MFYLFYPVLSSFILSNCQAGRGLSSLNPLIKPEFTTAGGNHLPRLSLPALPASAPNRAQQGAAADAENHRSA